MPLPPIVTQAIAALSPTGYLFPGHLDGHLSPAWVGTLIDRTLEPGVTTHMLRHRFATVAYLAERDIRAVQTLLGHAKVETTIIYTAVPDGALSNAVNAAAQL
jgi:site-specific recombinase XerD